MATDFDSRQEIVVGSRTARDLLRGGHIRQVRLQTRDGHTLIGAPIAIDVAQAVPGVFRAPVWAAACATSLVARLAGLQIVVEQDE